MEEQDDLSQYSEEQLQATLDHRLQQRHEAAATMELPKKADLDGMSEEDLETALAAHQIRNEKMLAPFRQQVAREAKEGKGLSSGPLAYIGRAAISPIRGPLTALVYANARGNVNAGNPSDENLRDIALYEHEQGLAQQQPEWAKWAGAGAEVAANIAPTVITGGANLAAQAYAGEAAAKGDGLFNPSAAASAGTSFAAQMGVLKAMGPLAQRLFPQSVTQNIAGRIGTEALTGTAGMAVADYATYATGLTEHGGPIKEALDGHLGDAARATAANLLFTGGMAAFHGGHEAGRQFVKDAVEDINQAARNGLPKDAAIRGVAAAVESVAKIEKLKTEAGPDQQAPGVINLPDGRTVDLQSPLSFGEAKSIGELPADKGQAAEAIASKLPNRVDVPSTSLSEGRAGRPAFGESTPQITHDVLDPNGKAVATVTVKPRMGGEELHLDWGGMLGSGTREQTWNAGRQAVKDTIAKLWEKYPEAQRIKYIRSTTGKAFTWFRPEVDPAEFNARREQNPEIAQDATGSTQPPDGPQSTEAARVQPGEAVGSGPGEISSSNPGQPASVTKWPPERVETMRAALQAIGVPGAAKMKPEKIRAEVERLGIDKAMERTTGAAKINQSVAEESASANASPDEPLHLGNRLLAGDGVGLDELLNAGLTRPEAHTILERIQGKRTLEDIANDKQALGRTYTRERIRQFEAGARKKLSIGESANVIRRGEQAESANLLNKRVASAEPGEAGEGQYKPPDFRPARTADEIESDRLSQLADQFIKDADSGKVSDQRLQELREAIAKGSPNVSAPQPAAKKEARAPLTTAKAEDRPKSKISIGERRRRQLIEQRMPDLVSDAKEYGVDLDDVHAYAKDLMKPVRDFQEELGRMKKDAMAYLQRQGVSRQQFAKAEDWASVKHFDELVRVVADKYPGLLKSKGFKLDEAYDASELDSSEQLFNLLKGRTASGDIRRGIETIDDAYRHAFSEIANAKERALRAEAERAGIQASDFERSVQAGEVSGSNPEAEANRGDAWLPEGYKATESDLSFDPSEFDRAAERVNPDVDPDIEPGSFGMGTAGRGASDPGVPLNSPGASAPVIPDGAKPGHVASGWFQAAKDWVSSFAQNQFPGLTRISRSSGEKLAQVANAPVAAKASWDYYSRILRVGDKTLAEMTPEERRAVGAVWMERRMREYRAKLERNGEDPGSVGTLVGQAGSPLQTEADYQAGRDALWGFWEAIKQEWTPEVEKNFRGLKGLEPSDAIEARSQIPGLPLNAIAVDPSNPVPGAVGTGKRQGMENLRLRRPGFLRSAELSAAAYDIDVAHMMERTLILGIPAARRVEFVREGMKDGVIAAITGGDKPPEGWKYLGLDPAAGVGLDSNAKYYVHPDAYRDVVQGLGIGERPGQTLASGVRPVAGLLNRFALLSPVELATHIGNHVTALFRAGMGTPIWNLKDSFANAYRLYVNDPEILRRVKDLTSIGAAFRHEPHAGILGEKYQQFDPTSYVNKFSSNLIDVMQKAVRIQLEDAFDRQVKAGLFEGGETNKRDYINQALGNYNSQANNRLTQFLKDSNLQPFATAAHTFTMQGAKVATGGAINAPATSAKAAAQLRAVALLKLLPFLTMGPVVNAMRWGQSFPNDVPSFAIKTREDDDGKVHYFDPLAFTGVRRGWRATGQNAVVEKLTHGGDRNMADQVTRDAWHSAEHLFAGPVVQAAHTALTGENAIGRRVAPQVSTARTPEGIAAAAKRGSPPPGSSQYWENIKAAAKGVNPLVATATDADKPSSPRTLWENVMQSMGPFGEKSRGKPDQKKRK